MARAIRAATGDRIVKLDELERVRLVRLSPGGGAPRPIDIRSDLRLVPEALLPGAVRNGRLVLPVASPDSWYWYAGVLDLQTGCAIQHSDLGVAGTYMMPVAPW